MKSLLKVPGFILIITTISSCSFLKNLSFYEDTDSYVNIQQERKKKLEMMALEKKQKEEREKFVRDSIAQEQEKLNNNPYYKEPHYNKDDYYDYEYAARIKRFYNPVIGLGYYDNWYTNYGFYGSTNYGTSIYMGYGNYIPYAGYSYWWGNPYYSYGLGTCWGNPFYSPFFNYGIYSPYYYGYGYPPYTYGYYPYGYYPYYGYGYNPYYYNAQDINSATYAPRRSYEGFNSRKTLNNINSENNLSRNTPATSPEINMPKFDEMARPKPVTKFESTQINAINAPIIHQINTHPNISTNIIPRNNWNESSGTSINNHTGTNIISTNPRSGNTNPGRPNLGGNPTPVPVGPREINPSMQNNATQKGRGSENPGGNFSVPRSGNNGSIERPR